MRTTDMKGIYSALLVSFDKEGNINEKGLRQIIRHNIDVCKVDGLYVGGSTGENFMLSTDEKKRIFEIARKVKVSIPDELYKYDHDTFEKYIHALWDGLMSSCSTLKVEV